MNTDTPSFTFSRTVAVLIFLASPVVMAATLSHDAFELTKCQVDISDLSGCTAQLDTQTQRKNYRLSRTDLQRFTRQLQQALARVCSGSS
jgi:hypothetical protein